MKRSTAFILILAIVVIGWALCSFTGFQDLLNNETSPVIYVTDEGNSITIAWLIWFVLFIVGWISLTILGYLIHPCVGELILRFGLIIIIKIFDKDNDSDFGLGGSGSGRSGRGG